MIDAVAPTPVLAAGGIGNGRQIAAALAMGAEGVWTGSLWLTVEGRHPAGADAVPTSTPPAATRCAPFVDRQALPDAAQRLDRRVGPNPEPQPLGMPLQFMVTGEAVAARPRLPGAGQDVNFNPVGQVVGQMNKVRRSRTSCWAWSRSTLEATGRPNELNEQAGPESITGLSPLRGGDALDLDESFRNRTDESAPDPLHRTPAGLTAPRPVPAADDHRHRRVPVLEDLHDRRHRLSLHRPHGRVGPVRAARHRLLGSVASSRSSWRSGASPRRSRRPHLVNGDSEATTTTISADIPAAGRSHPTPLGRVAPSSRPQAAQRRDVVHRHRKLPVIRDVAGRSSQNSSVGGRSPCRDRSAARRCRP